MGKLNIAHHKSYHPYRLDNIERVRRDEEEVRLKEAAEEGRMQLADSEARIGLLRERAGVDKKKSKRQIEKEEEKALTQPNPAINPPEPQTNVDERGHINFFADLEQHASMSASANVTKPGKNGQVAETEKGVPLGLSEKDMKRWYSDSSRKMLDEQEDDKRSREMSLKASHDPLTGINQHFSLRDHLRKQSLPRSDRVSSNAPSRPPESPSDARRVREASERDRARALIARKRREIEASSVTTTPRTEHGYRDVFNRDEVDEAAEARRRRYGDRSWRR